MRTIGFLVASACLAAEVSAFLPPTPFVTRGPLVRARGQSVLMAASVDEYKAAYEDLKEMIDKANCAPIMVRFAWHDSGTFNKENADKPFPERGGADGSIRFEPELKHGANAGLGVALKLLEPIKKKHASVGWADLIQAASAAAIEVTGGPKIPLRYGRVDAQGPDDCPQEGNLPGANRAGEQKAPFSDGTKTPADHLRKVFHRMGLSDKDIVALSGAHTLGRAYKDRSGLGDEQTKYTTGEHVARKDGKSGYGRKGGQPWTERWLKFDNSYFSTVYDPNADPELLKLDTDLCLFGDEGFRPFAVKYAEDQDAFFQDYIESHLKLSELGSEWEGGKPIEV